MRNKYWEVVDQCRLLIGDAPAFQGVDPTSRLLAYGALVLEAAQKELALMDKALKKDLKKALKYFKSIQCLEMAGNWRIKLTDNSYGLTIERTESLQFVRVYADRSVVHLTCQEINGGFYANSAIVFNDLASINVAGKSLIEIGGILFEANDKEAYGAVYLLNPRMALRASRDERSDAIKCFPLSVFAFDKLSEEEVIQAIRLNPLDCLRIIQCFPSSKWILMEVLISFVSHWTSDLDEDIGILLSKIALVSPEFSDELDKTIKFLMGMFHPESCEDFEALGLALREQLKGRFMDGIYREYVEKI